MLCSTDAEHGPLWCCTHGAVASGHVQGARAFSGVFCTCSKKGFSGSGWPGQRDCEAGLMIKLSFAKFAHTEN